jgi:hypothetical protein
MDYWPLILYDVAMTNTSEFLTKSPHSLISAAAKSAFVPTSRSVVAANRGSGSVTAALELAQNPALDARRLWCDRAFSIAARRWTIRAIEAGLLSVDCLKASHASVHAA